jgi:integrase
VSGRDGGFDGGVMAQQGDPVGFTRKRVWPSGRVTYAAVYRDARGKVRQAGTHSSRKQADRAWQRAEALMGAGAPGDPTAGRVSLSEYVNQTWFPNHVMEPTTREGYRYCIDRHILPAFGSMKMRDILPMHVREWVTELTATGVSPAQIRHLKIILSAIFTTALNDFVVALHPCRGVKTPTVPVRDYRIVTPVELDLLLDALPSDAARLLVEVSIGSGLRWGELIELRPADLQPATGIVAVSRKVVEVNPAFHPDGGRFLIQAYPKTKRPRRLKLDPELVAAIGRHVADHEMSPSDLLFPLELLLPPTDQQTIQAVEDLGLTEPNGVGRSYRHGTLSAYTAGRCRCEHCRTAFATYRSGRRSAGLDSPRRPARIRDTDGHLPRDWFRHRIWIPACKRAGLEPRPRLHDLRHSHASWLLAGGADLQVVKERLGHGSIATTGKYLHTLPTADETAIAALRRTRARGA